MLSDEEKKAWDRVIIMKNFICCDSDDDYENNEAIQDVEAINTLLNLIEKQSKEIEELREEKAKRQWVHIKENGEVEPLFYVSEDKIKAKIEETNNEELNYNEDEYWLEQEIKGYAIDKMQSLLEKE